MRNIDELDLICIKENILESNFILKENDKLFSHQIWKGRYSDNKIKFFDKCFKTNIATSIFAYLIWKQCINGEYVNNIIKQLVQARLLIVKKGSEIDEQI